VSDQTEPSGHLLGAIFSASPDAVVVIDAAGRIILASRAITDLFGYFPEELVGEPIEILVPVDTRVSHAHHLAQFFGAPRARQMGDGLELAGRHHDGTQFAVEVSLAPVRVHDVNYAAAFIRDGRERRRAIDRANAVNEITQRILGGSGAEEILPLVAQRARRLSGSQAVWVVTPNSSGELEITSVDGPGTQRLLGVKLSQDTSRSAVVMRTSASEVIEDLSAADNVPSQVVPLDLGPALYVPLIADERPLGTLVLGRTHGEPQFGPLDVAFAEVFATAIASSIENGEVRAELERLSLASEHERIGFDLHDTVIQRLFAIGLSLQATHATVSGKTADRIESAVENLDGVIREIRNTIFRLSERTESARGLRDGLLRLGDKYSEELGFSPRFAFRGAVDASVPEIVTEQLLQVANEALSNVSRHAHATSIEAVVVVEDGWLTFSLLDDGVGLLGQPSAGQGLSNMSIRASNLGGSCTISPRDPTGTMLDWRVPIQG
jgi:PAS domain S-box-containing protein